MHHVNRFAAFSGLLFAATEAAAIAVFSSGMLTPETISQVPQGFGAYGGSYFVPDAARSSPDTMLHNIWSVPQRGGAPTIFSTGNTETLLGGLFLPPEWGAGTQYAADSGKFAVTTRAGTSGNDGAVFIYDAGGTRRQLALVADAFQFDQPQIAPAGFGSYFGDLITPGFQAIYAIEPDGNVRIVAQHPILEAGFGMAFAPAGFGAFGGKLFVSNIYTGGGGLAVVDADGNVTVFPTTELPTTLPAPCESCGGRQIAFGPPGFIPGYGALMFVSMSGSAIGGGALGNIFAVDSDGTIVASLRDDLGLTKFDPRGMLFIDGGQLLISDSSDPILIATSNDFQRLAAPEPATLMLLALGLACVAGLRAKDFHPICATRRSG